MSDYRIVAKVKNNRILSLIEGAGFNSIAEFCRTNGLKYTAVSALVTMRQAPRSQSGWYKVTVDLATALHVEPEELFNDRQLKGGNAMTITRIVDDVSLEHATSIALPSPDKEVMDRLDVERLMGGMQPRDRRVIEMSFGLKGEGESTLREIGDEIGLSVERVRQLQARAIRLMRRHK